MVIQGQYRKHETGKTVDREMQVKRRKRGQVAKGFRREKFQGQGLLRNRCKGNETNPGIWRKVSLGARVRGDEDEEVNEGCRLSSKEGGREKERLIQMYAPFSLLNAPSSSSRDTWVIMDDASI